MNKIQLMEKTIAFYEKAFSNAECPRKFLEERFITDAGIFTRHRLGYSDGNLLESLPKEGRIIDELTELGILKDKKEYFRDCIILPITDLELNIINIAGININTGKALFLLEDNRIFNQSITHEYPQVYAIDTLLDCLIFEQAEIFNVIYAEDAVRIRGIEIFKIKPPKGGYLKYFRERKAVGLQKYVSSQAEDSESEESHSEKQAIQQQFQGNDSYTKLPNGFSIQYGMRRYSILCIEKGKKLKATVKIEKGGRLHADSIDFYSARERRQLAVDICNVLDELPETVNSELINIIRLAEKYDDNNSKQFKPENEEEISEEDERLAMAFGKDENLIDLILKDYEKCGVIGDNNTKLICYLAMSSRKMTEPLSILIQAGSGAGKSHIQNQTLLFCNPSEVLKVTNLSEKSLFYLETKSGYSLKNKVLAIEEGTGAESAAYSLRALISSGDGISTLTTIKDSNTGKLVTMSNRVEGPVSVFFTTTKPQIEEELRSRMLVLSIDESPDQSEKIVRVMKEKYKAETLEADIDIKSVRKKHRAFQQILKPLKVVNPHVDRLKINDYRLQTRRTLQLYLSIINSIAFIRQFQKETRTLTEHSTMVDYIEVDENDIKIGHDLAKSVMDQAWDLSQPARTLCCLINQMLEEKIIRLQKENPDTDYRKMDMEWTRRMLREFTGWRQTRLRNHLMELVDYEIVIRKGGQGRMQYYQLVHEGELNDNNSFCEWQG